MTENPASLFHKNRPVLVFCQLMFAYCHFTIQFYNTNINRKGAPLPHILFYKVWKYRLLVFFSLIIFGIILVLQNFAKTV